MSAREPVFRAIGAVAYAWLMPARIGDQAFWYCTNLTSVYLMRPGKSPHFWTNPRAEAAT